MEKTKTSMALSETAAGRSNGLARHQMEFTKFLVDRKGNVVARHGPQVKPESLSKDIERLLKDPV